jgi:hypothetical protein
VRDQVGPCRRLAEPLAQRHRVVGEVEDERLPQPEDGAQFGRQARVEDAAGQADLDAHQPGLPRGLEQPGDPEPADPQPVGDVDLGDALQVELPRHQRGQHDFRRPISRQAGHECLHTCAHLSVFISYWQLFLTLPSRTFTVSS